MKRPLGDTNRPRGLLRVDKGSVTTFLWLVGAFAGLGVLTATASALSSPLYPVPEDAHPLPRSPYYVFSRMTDADLALIQVKLTYVGFRTSSPPCVVFAVDSSAIDVARFRPFWRKRIFYWDEYRRPTIFLVSKEEMRSVLRRVGDLPEVTSGGRDSAAVYSFAIEGTIGGIDRVFESLLNRNAARPLFATLIEIMRPEDLRGMYLEDLAEMQALLPSKGGEARR